MLTEHAPDVFVEHVEAGSPSGSTIGIDVTKAGVRRGEYFDRITHPGPAPALCEAVSTGTCGDCLVSQDRPKRDTISIEEVTVSTMWEIRTTL